MLRRITVAESRNIKNSNCCMLYMLRRITVAESRNIKNSNCCMLYMLRRITVAENRNLNCYMIHVKKDKCCSKLAAAT